MSLVTLETPDGPLRADLDRPIDVSIPLRFDGPQPEFFGAPVATARPLEVGDWVGDTRRGAGCNVSVHTLTPHCNGTNTESVGHVTNEPVPIFEVLRGGLAPATLITVVPVDAGTVDETSDPALEPGQRVIAAGAIAAALGTAERIEALLIRTTPNPASKREAAYRFDAPPPFLTLEAAALCVSRDVRHLLVDVPSLDGMGDGGRMSAHHVFWGLPPGSHDREEATRAEATVTEMIYVPDVVADGRFLLDLQIPPFAADAAPSRPILYEVL